MRLNLEKYMNYRVKVRMRDGRWMEGTMMAIDEDVNAVLDDTEEFRRMKGSKETRRRTLGLVVVRGGFVVDVEVISKPYS
ncbi:Sm-like protein [Encephalitozoon hellem ATCC 50504]|uniref:Sm protein B n=1 Tax=Encephalitozoon hellem TaxID=27973 RepID=A0A9Q9CD84_ENCHE|nr:Sm-like protein [Encephalitozoon hellem ATCC 50504]AFM98752.1 Sm-like protein [Encephalitozoon hellem ATCC 50504]UTX43728.1 small nuclear ribonucleoprotein-associated proteins B/B' [Encephalitozoon hellem]WEL39205.1 small nuclear Sm-like ribonucleoprotein [Encephalitozoon hellem]|eukprot:XP_003887733.1 Sm-like protein [Encephalitozoon hellem ATCC 50504]